MAEQNHDTKQTIEITVTYLEMTVCPNRDSPRHAPAGILPLKVLKPPLHFYRYLFATVGGPWQWWERSVQGDEELRSLLNDPAVDLFVPYVSGVPAGLAEVDRRAFPDIQLVYFGLVPEFIGKGIGAYFLDWVVDQAWSLQPRRVWLHTCSLDSPRALPVYRKAGFVPYEVRKKRIVDPAIRMAQAGASS